MKERSPLVIRKRIHFTGDPLTGYSIVLKFCSLNPDTCHSYKNGNCNAPEFRGLGEDLKCPNSDRTTNDVK